MEMKKVLEVGPWGSPADVYVSNPFVRYSGVDTCVWGRESDPKAGSKEFKDLFLRGIECSRDPSDNGRVRIDRRPLSELPEFGFDTILLGNVFGDPRAVKKKTGGYPADYPGFRSFVGDLASRLAPGGVLEVLETYTPFRYDSLAILLGEAGLECAEYENERADIEERIRKLYRVNRFAMLDSLDDERRKRACAKHGVPAERPYWARFKIEG